MVRKFQIDAAAYLWLALGLLVLPVGWLAAAMVAAVFHELCHYTAAGIVGISVRSVRVGVLGCRMETDEMSSCQEILCALAGPMGSLLLIFTLNCFPRLAICGAIQGMFNLLPVYPLDGGRVLRGLLGFLLKDSRAEKICCGVEICLMIFLLTGAVGLSLRYKLGLMPMIFAMILCTRLFRPKNSLQTGASRGTIDLPFLKR